MKSPQHWDEPRVYSRPVFVCVLPGTSFGRANIDIGVDILCLWQETPSLQILLIVLPEGLWLLFLTKTLHLGGARGQLKVQASCRVTIEKRGEGGERRREKVARTQG